MALFLLDMNAIFISIGTGVITAFIIAGAGFLWKINGSLAVIMAELKHISQIADITYKDYDRRFQELTKDFEELRVELADLRKQRTVA